MPQVLLIGATSAIAQALTRLYAARGASLILWGRSAEKLEIIAADLRARYHSTVATEAFDFDVFAGHAPLLERTIAAHGALDIAIICHGSLGDQKACEQNFAVAAKELQTNALSALSFLTVLANDFESRGQGVIAAISSVAGDRGRQSNYVYGTSKAAIDTFLEGLRNRLYSKGVMVLTIKPGFVATPMTAHLKQGPLFVSPERVARDIVSAIDRGRSTVYTPWFWRWIMLVIKLIPEVIFRRLKL